MECQIQWDTQEDQSRITEMENPKWDQDIDISHCLINSLIPEPQVYFLWFTDSRFMSSSLFG